MEMHVSVSATRNDHCVSCLFNQITKNFSISYFLTHKTICLEIDCCTENNFI